MRDSWRYALFGPGEFSDWSLPLLPQCGSVAMLSPGLRADSPLRMEARDQFASRGLTPTLLPTATAEHDLDAIGAAGFVYLQGGNPVAIVQQLAGSAIWNQVQESDVPILATSGGVMALGALTVDLIDSAEWTAGLECLPNAILAAHWNRLGEMLPAVRARYEARPADKTFIALDEEAVLVGDGETWTTHGPGEVMVVQPGGVAERLTDGDHIAVRLSA